MGILTSVVKERFLDNLKDYCLFAKDDDSMSVVEWANGEGYTISIEAKNMGTRVFQMTMGELEALNVLVNYRGE